MVFLFQVPGPAAEVRVQRLPPPPPSQEAFTGDRTTVLVPTQVPSSSEGVPPPPPPPRTTASHSRSSSIDDQLIDLSDEGDALNILDCNFYYGLHGAALLQLNCNYFVFFSQGRVASSYPPLFPLDYRQKKYVLIICCLVLNGCFVVTYGTSYVM